jgi:Na+/melibiose symporter-like transporter
MSAPCVDNRELTTWRLLAYGFPALPYAFVAMPLYMILPTYYAAHTSVTLAQIGAIAAFSRIFDAFIDPVVGYLSDRTRTRWGARKPWMLGALICCCAAVVPLFQPPHEATVLYFAVWSLLMYTGFTMFDIPRQAWSAELSRDYQKRSRIVMFVAMFNISGSLIFWIMPLVLAQFTGDTAIGGDTLRGISWLYLVVMPLGILASVVFVPTGQVVAKQVSSLRETLPSLWRSKPLRRYVLIHSLWGLGQGSMMATIFIFQTDYMGLAKEFSYVMITVFLFQVIALPLWSRILKRVDRHRIWGLCVALTSVTAPILLLLPRGPAALVPVLLLVMIKGVLGAPANFIPTAVLSDVIDYDSMKTGVNKAANFFAIQTILVKVTMALGGALGFFILDLYDFHVGARNTPHAEFGLVIAFMLVPIFFHLLMAAVCWNFPIDRRRHRIIQRKLERRAGLLAQA